MQLTLINKHFNACDQQWDDMPQQDNGRHCQQCDRVLVDLTDKTEQQVLELQMQHNFKLCGRYTVDQVHRLDRYLTLQEQPKRNYMPWLVKLAMGLGASGLPMLAAAQEPVNVQQELLSDSETVDIEGVAKVIAGTVVDEKYGDVENCQVKLEVDLKGVKVTHTDTNGRFVIELSNDEWSAIKASNEFKLWFTPIPGYRSQLSYFETSRLEVTDTLFVDEVFYREDIQYKTVGVLEIRKDPSSENERRNYDFFNNIYRWE